MVKPEYGGNVNFEIKSQFMRELKEDTFSENKNDDAHEHVERVLDIVSLFNILGVSHDAVMLRVFAITLTRAAKRWVDRLPPGTLEEICNFKQEGDETLYQSWEWYNDLLYKCLTHDINNHQKKLGSTSGIGACKEALNKKKLLLHTRSICYKKMDQDSAYMVAASKVPMLKPGEYKLWRIRMEQYIQMIDYSLWEVIENEVFVANQYKNVIEKEVDVSQVQVSTAATAPTISIDEATLAQALAELKYAKPKAKAKGIVFHEPEESTTITIPKPKSQDNGKAKMIEEHVKLKKKDQIMLDEEVALELQAELQAEFDKEQRFASEKAQKEEEETNIALIESWDDVQAKINADYQLAQRLQAEEQEELTDAKKATLFMQLLEKKRKFFFKKESRRKEELLQESKPPYSSGLG
nr:hypothetical protein [Tanacetum cinerariifolium]